MHAQCSASHAAVYAVRAIIEQPLHTRCPHALREDREEKIQAVQEELSDRGPDVAPLKTGGDVNHARAFRADKTCGLGYGMPQLQVCSGGGGGDSKGRTVQEVAEDGQKALQVFSHVHQPKHLLRRPARRRRL